MKRISLMLTILLTLSVCFTACKSNDQRPHIHDFGEWETLNAPTLIENGVRERKCACGETETEQIICADYTVTIDNRNTIGYTGADGERLVIPSVFLESVSNKWYKVTDIDDMSFNGCKKLEIVLIQDGITSIGKNAFDSCASLTSVTIGDDVTDIGEMAFSGCINLKLVSLGNGIQYISRGCFEMCSALSDIAIPDSVTMIGDEAFAHCTKLKSILIPDSVLDIGDYAFEACFALETVYYTGTQEQWERISYGTGNSALMRANIVYNYAG